jgi:hypothetical protein
MEVLYDKEDDKGFLKSAPIWLVVSDKRTAHDWPALYRNKSAATAVKSLAAGPGQLVKMSRFEPTKFAP